MVKYRFLVLIAVTIFFFACEDIIELEDISNQEVVALAPLEGATINGNEISFNWNEVEEASGYHIQVATPNFASASQVVLDSTMFKDTLGYVATKINKTLLNSSYEWRVKAINSGYETVYTTNYFTVNGDEDLDIIPPEKPSLSSPVDKDNLTNTSVNFKWTRENVSGTTEIDSIYIYSDQELKTIKRKDIGANKGYNATLEEGTYYWNVKAYDEAGNKSDVSSTFSFTIE